MTLLPFWRFVDIHIEVRYGSQLKKVAHKYDIDPTEIIVGPRLRLTQIRVQIDEHFTVHHADLVDDQILTNGPVFPLGIAYTFLFLCSNWMIGSTMKGNAGDVESGRASGGGNNELILSIELSK